MARKRRMPPTASSVRELATRRAYLIRREDGSPRRYRLFSMSGRRVSPVVSKDPKHRYSWRLSEADAWLRTQPLLRDL